MRQISMDRQFSRRQVLGLFAMAGGALLLAACGGTATALPATATPAASAASSTAASAAASSAPSAPPSAAPSAAASATPVASGSASPAASAAASPTTRPASPIVATPRASGSPVVAPGGPFLSAGTDLGRMLATLPRDADILRGQWAYTYANLGQQLQNYGLAGTTSSAEISSQDSFARFSKATAGLPFPMEAHPAESLAIGEDEWRAVVGYDFWQLDRIFAEENPDARWVRLEGRFDRDAIAKALVGSKRTASQYREGTIYSYGPDSAIDLKDPVTDRLGLIGSFSRTVIEEAALASVKTTQLAESAIDVRAGRVPSLLANPDYDALAFALDPIVGAALLPPEQLYGRVERNGTPIPPGTPTAGAEQLPLYRRVGIGLQDDGTKHTMVIALVYERAEDARAAAPLVRSRAENYQLRGGSLLRDRVVPGEPRVVTAGSRTVAVLPLAIVDDRYLGLWRSMFDNRDLGFLKEY